MADSPETLVDVLREHARARADREACRFLIDGEEQADAWSYRELDLRARAIAVTLAERVGAGERVLLLYPPGLEFIAAFLGCLYRGAIAVPAYPPTSHRTLPRILSILRDARPAAVLTAREVSERTRSFRARVPELAAPAWITTDDLADPAAAAAAWRPPAAAAETVCFLQYTSGSTATPKGVCVSHGNLLHNERMIRDAFGQDAASVIVGWLPLYHDMGLIGNVLQPLFLGARCILMSPLAFLKRPARWLEAISRYRATTSGSPNFGYELCLRKVAPEARRELDLASWRVAYNGAEPVRAATLERFAAGFAASGFRREAFYPCYGLAEATLFVSGGTVGAPPVIETVASAALERHEARAGTADAAAVRLVGCGRAWLEQELRVVEPETGRPRQAGEVGEIWVSGPSVAGGYWGRPAESARTFGAVTAGGEGPFLRTGDLGFVSAGGELVVTGRLKDLIILRGRNHYPQDLELTAETCHPALRPGGGAAFAVEVDDEERLVLVEEVERGFKGDLGQVAAAVRQAVAEKHQAHVHAVALISAGSLPKTSSGKVQRRLTRQLFLAGELREMARSEAAAASAGVDAIEVDRAALARLPADERRSTLAAYLGQVVAALARVPPAEVEPAAPLTALGLDSLMAVELRSRIEADLGCEVDLGELLRGPSLNELAARLAAAPAPAAAPGGETGPPDGLLSYGQRAMWFLQRLDPGSPAYNVVAALRVRAELDVARLEQVFEVLARRHPALRTRFRATPEGPRQEVSEDRRVEPVVEDAASWSDAELEEQVTRRAHAPFDLEADPLLRVRLFTRGARDHVLLLVVHHVISDLGSLGVLFSELRALYALGPERSAEVLAPLPASYADHVRWQERWLAGPAGEQAWRYWRQRLAGELPELALPTDRPRPPHQTFGGAARDLLLAPAAAEALRSLAARHGTTLYTVLLAAFQGLLARYSGQREVVLGTPALGRPRAELGQVVGYFVNPVVMRTATAGNPGFGELLAQVRQTVREALEHHDYPFPLLVERLHPQRDPSRSPIFQATFVLQQSGLLSETDLAAFALGRRGVELDFAGLPARSFPLARQIAPFDLSLIAAETGAGLGFSLLYNSDLFDAATARRVLGHFAVLLGAAAADPARRLAELPLLAGGEAAQLAEWNAAAGGYPHDRTVPELFAEQAARTPDAVAVVAGGAATTYRRLAAESGRLAGRLRELGVGPETVVGLCLARGPELVTAILAILRAGGAYLPLDAAFPPERLALMLADSGARLALTREALADRLPAALPRLLLDRKTPSPAAAPGAGPAPEHLAYVIYTSGSTGRPKGVPIVHATLVPTLLWGRDYFGLGPSTRALQSLSHVFDFGVFELLTTVLFGGTLHVLDDEELADPRRYARYAATRAINTVHATPSFIRQALAGGEGLPALAILHLGGEALAGKIIDDLLAALPPDCVVYNGYGPTEATINSTIFAVGSARRRRDGGRAATPIGRRSANHRTYVLDRRARALPIGVPGELWVGGDGLTRGYLGRPALSAEKVVPDPCRGAAGARAYRTGDLVRALPDGNLEFLGRIDHQVKVRGFRVELGEIEAALLRHPAVTAAVVAAHDAGAAGRVLAAWVAPAVPAEVRGFLGATLPDYMVPSLYVGLERLPLLPTGKVDRRALPAPELSAPASAAPSTPLEELLAGLWAEVLGRERVGVHDDFFELGGHSLLATQLVTRIRVACGEELSLRQLFAAPTVAATAAALAARRRAQEPAPEPRLVPLPRTRGDRQSFALSFAQERLWLLERLGLEPALYNVPAALRLTGALDPRALERAFAAVVDRHEALRTTFEEHRGEPVQVVHRRLPPGWGRVDLDGLPAASRRAAVAALRAADARRPFDLAAGPLVRAAVLRLGEGEHVLLLSMHHVVSDGWSAGILLRELAAFYGAFAAAGPPPRLPALPVQYADFAAWQRRRLREDVVERQLDYWRRRLAGLPPLELPCDRPRHAAASPRGGVRSSLLPPATATALRRLGRGAGATLFMTLLGGFYALLARTTGQRDLAVGSTIANRGQREIEDLIGFFVNTLVLRADLGGDPTFVAIVERVGDVTLGAYAHQDLPFQALVNRLAPQRELHGTPFFRVMLTLDAPLGALELPGLALELLPAAAGAAKFELALAVAESARGLECTWSYRADLFDAATVARLAGHFAVLLGAAAADPARRLAELPLLAAGEAAQLAEWNAAAGGYPHDRTVPELFAEQVARTPDAVAVVAGGAATTYRRLAAESGRLAGRLRELGVGPEIVVGLCLARGPELVTAILAILRAGGAYLPLDAAFPPQRLALMLADSGARLALTREALADRLPAALPRLLLDRETLLASPPAAGPAPEHLAYVIYTSGSTGRPKGVPIVHATLVPTLLWGRDYFGLGPSTRVLQSLSHVFDFGVFELLTTVLFGGTLHVLDDAELADPRRYARYAATRAINTVHATPSFIRQVVAIGEALPALATLHLGGEALNGQMIDDLLTALPPDCVVYNGYGPTEATINSTIFAVGSARRRRDGGRAATPIGRRSANHRTYVLDRRARALPIGVPGELWVGGEGLTRGYLGRPALSAEKVVPDPCRGAAGARAYRTGDLVRALPDGNLEFLGRIDHQVKVRGFRVELGEIEAALVRHPAVTAAVVAAHDAGAAGRVLAAWVVPAVPAEVRGFLGATLPDAMVPSLYVGLERLPLLPTGKVDRRALPAPEPAAPASAVAPRTPLEELLAGLWAEVLGRERVGVYDDFFELGGHSLLATRLAARIREACGEELSLRRLFAAPTVAATAAALAAGGAAQPRLRIVPLPRARGAERQSFALSFAQERLWLLERLELEPALYSVPVALRLAGDLDAGALERALAAVADRHEALRTTFEEQQGEPVQVVHRRLPPGWGRVDLAGLPAASRRAAVAALRAADARRPFDLAAGPLLRAAVLRLGEGEHVLLLNMHHVVSDGWSAGVLLRELAAFYGAFATAGPAPRLPALPVQYADFAAWQRRRLQGDAVERLLDYWRPRLAGLPPLELPCDRPRHAAAGARGGLVTSLLPPPLTGGLHELGHGARATLFMTLLAGFYALLARYSGQRDLAVGSAIANRGQTEIEDLIGFFVNTLVLRADLGGNPAFAEVLERVGDVTLGAYAHQDLPFQVLVERLAPQRELDVTPFFRVMLTLANAPLGALELPGLALELLPAAAGAAKFDLTLAVTESARGLECAWSYRADLFDAATVARLAGHFAVLLGAAAADPSRRLAELPLLAAGEAAQLAEWNAAAGGYPHDRTVPELFAEQVARTPDAVAVVAGGAATTYRRLAAESGRLAGRLRELGVGPEIVVGLCLARGPELVTAILAILRAGGAYLPLDAAFPPQRLALMLADSGARLALTREALADRLPAALPRLLLDRETPSPAAAPGAGPAPEHLAYVIYTSGSTGRPKGVPIAHAQLVPTLLWGRDYFGLGPSARVLQSLSHVFDFGVFEILTTVLFGGTLHVPDEEELTDPRRYARYAAAHAVNTVHATPSFIRQVVATGEALPALATLHLGGEALSGPMIDDLLAALPPGCVVYNGYGPTEATINSAIFRAGSTRDRRDGGRVATPIGRRSANHRTYVLDRRGHRLPIGVPGELWVGGDGLTRGYLGRPALTAEKLVPDPCRAGTGARAYRTGDLVRFLADGNLEFLGRTDHQVKVRGFRVELGEIEAALVRHPAVTAAVVAAHDAGAAGRVLAAWVAPAVPADVRGFLGATLPDAMVPSLYVGLERLPLLPTGKVDRRALPAPEPAAPASAAAPSTPLEELLAGLWAEVLGRERVGVHDSFFELGGHSLLATRLVARIRQACGEELSLRQLFAAPTVAATAAALATRRGPQPEPDLLPLPRARGAERQSFALSFAQERLWLLERLGIGPALYNIPVALRLAGDLDARALERALAAVVDRHEALRTTFEEHRGEPVQVVHRRLPPRWGRVDLDGLPAASRRAAVAALRAADARRPFDLAAGPLVRAAVLRLGEGEHVLLLSMHHVVSDGWSAGILLRELAAFYGAFAAAGPPPRLPALPVQYADFAAWQRRRLQGDAVERQLDYWRPRLAGLPPLELPCDRPQHTTASPHGDLATSLLPRPLATALHRLGRGAGTTLFMTLLAGFYALLARYSGQRDLAVGSAIANRGQREIEDLIGFFVNTLVLRAELGRDPSFAAILERVSDVTLGAYAHQDLPFQTLVNRLAPQRELDATPFFRVMLTLANTPMGALELPGLALELLPPDSGTAKFDLALAVAESARGLECVWSYRTALFDAATVARLARHFAVLLGAAAADSARRLAELPLLAAAERHQALWEWNAQPALPAAAPLPEMIAAQAARAPDRTALSMGEAWWTYGEVNARADRLAHQLRGLGVGPEVPVGVCLERSAELTVSLLAVLKAGGAYLPLDAANPPERLAFMIADAGARVVLTAAALRARLPRHGLTVLEVAALAGSTAAASAGEPPPPALGEHPAYVIYTSGSTGRPKGVVVSHAAVASRLRWAAAVELDADSRYLQKTNVNFDASLAEVFAPLIAGAYGVAAAADLGRDAAYLARLIAERRITHTSFPMALLSAALDDPSFGRCRGLRQVLVGGEKVPEELPPRFYAVMPRAVVLENRYGPTETTISVTAWRCRPAPEGALPIGRPIAGAEVYLVDRWGQPVPAVVPGEILIGGPTLARGYLGRPALTAGSFVPHPLARRPGARLYRTGDQARYRADGALEFLGRLDAQVKIRGFRVELGEIEAALGRHPAVHQAAVVDLADGATRKLAAYVVPAVGRLEGAVATLGDDPAAELGAFLAASLPEHMVPAAWTVLDALPLTAVGKVDRRALPAPSWRAAAAGDSHAEPRTPLEQWLAALWSELLEVEDVGIRDDFFALGGHSLLATQVVSRVREVWGVELELRRLFESPTVEGLAAAVAGAEAGAAPPLVRRPRAGALATSFAQERMWFLDQLLQEPRDTAASYHLSAAFRLAGELDPAALAASLAAVAERHETLRTCFAADAGRPVQVVAPRLAGGLAQVDLAALPAARRTAAAARLLPHAAARPFDLARAPLWRAVLLRLEPREHVLLVVMHHAIADGWSVGVLVREVAELYGARREGRAARLEPLPVQYADFAAWQRRLLDGAVLERQLAFWHRQLAGAPALIELPADRPRPQVWSPHGGYLALRLGAGLAEALAALARRRGATLFMTLLAAFQALLARLSGQDDVVVGSPIAGRNRREVEGLIGFFVNTLVLRARLGAAAPTFAELLEQVRATALGAYAHQDVPFERLVEELRPERSLGHTPLFQVMFALQNVPRVTLHLPGLELSPWPFAERAGAKFDLTLVVSETPRGLEGGLEHSLALFDATTARRLLGHWQALLAGAAAEPRTRLAELPLLAPAQRQQLLVEWNDTAARPGRGAVHERVAARAARAPDAVAVAAGDAALTYGELDRRARRLARDLRSWGVAPEALVGLCMERSPEMVVGALAVLYAGGAYVPVDPAVPAERLAYQLTDARAAIVLTQQRRTPALRGIAARLVCLDRRDSAAGDAGGEVVTPDPDHLAYVIYTSGSTGRPKGTELAHAGLANLVDWHLERYAVTAADRASLLAGTGFDASVWELWPYLCRGASIHVPPAESIAAPEQLLHWLTTRRVTLSFMPTPLAEAVQAHTPAGGALRALLTGGDRLRRAPAPALPFALVNHYGPTESTVVATAARIPPAAGPHAPPPIGAPIANVRAYVLGHRLRPVPARVAGELHVAGAGLARGYLRRPRLSARKFIPDPFAAAPGGRLYATGDRVRYLPAGALEFLARVDDQVKIRGFRVELGEIEAVLLSRPGVREAAVALQAAAAGSAGRLVAYVAADAAGGALDVTELRGELEKTLPEYMVPALFVTLEALPLTASGKVDRKALPAPPWAGAAAAFVAPSTPLEELLAALWGDVLGNARIGVHDSFFELGGHSLMATQLVSRLRQALGVELPLRQLFATPTVAGLAAVLAAGELAAAEAEIRPLARDGAPLPLSFAQERLWFLDRLEGGSSAYNIPAAVRLRGRLAVGALERALAALGGRHETLRTVFAATADGEPRQLVLPRLALPLPVVDCAGLGAVARRREAERLAIAAARERFDLGRGPLLRARLLRLGAREHVLSLTLHHAVADGWSMSLLIRELGALYRAFAQGAPPALPPLAVQYADYAAWQRHRVSGEVLERQLEYWRSQLGGDSAPLELPTDRPRPPRQTYRGASCKRELGRELGARLKELSRSSNATLFMTLLAAFKVLLGRLAGARTVVVGTPIAGRRRHEVEGLVGMFLNHLALATDLGGNPSFHELLARVRRTALDAYAHQDVPFERLLDELRPERDLARTPLFQIYFNMLNLPSWETELPGLTMEQVALPETVAKFDLTLYTAERDDGIFFDLVYNADLFDAGRAALLLEQYAALLGQVAAAPARPIGELALATPASRARLPVGEPRLDRAWRGAVTDLFAAGAETWGDRTAIAGPEGCWSYRELAARSHRLAHRLLEHGLERGRPVIIYGHRSSPLVGAVLATLAAGGAFVIVDPAYPAARLVEIVGLARPGVWIALAAAGPEPPEVLARLAELGCPRLRLAPWRRDDELAAGPTHAPGVEVGPEDLALIAFTSGSTGVPKGILGRHGPLTHFQPFQAERFALGADGERYSLLSGLAHDPLQRDLFTPLVLGGTIVIPAPERMFEPGYLAAWVRREQIGVAHLTPALGQLLGDDTGTPAAGTPAALRRAFIVGDVLRRRDVERLQRLAPGLTCVNLYGSTETQRAVGFYESPPGRAGAAGAVHPILPLGRGMRGVELLVLTAGGALADIGELGEVAVRSPHLARGYLADPRLTAARFQPDPLSGAPGERLYRTGDLGRYLPDGDAVFAGRGDRQVKIRGFRVELAEIEAVLDAHPAVRRAVVIPREEAARGRILAAYVVPEAPLAGGALRDFLAARLPAYMVPAAFVELDALPLNPNRKIDRAALARRPLPAVDAPADSFVAPRDPLELELAGIWEELLGGAPVGVRAGFFELGGHSLLAVRLLARVERRLGVTLPLSALFEHPTVESLAALLRARREAGPEPLLVALRGGGGRPPVFWAHPLGGNVLCYRELAAGLDPEQPFYALQSPGLDGRRPLLTTVEEMAACYVDEIRTVQSDGPYRLGGWSMGGLVAYEMARQLREQGAEVALLTLLDTRVPAPRATEPGAPEPRGELDHLYLGGRRAGELLDPETLAGKSPDEKLALVLARAQELGLAPADLGPDQARRLFAVLRSNQAARLRYRPRPYAGDMVLFRAADQSFSGGGDPADGWRALVAGRLRVAEIPGDHFSVLERPGVEALARVLAGHLALTAADPRS